VLAGPFILCRTAFLALAKLHNGRDSFTDKEVKDSLERRAERIAKRAEQADQEEKSKHSRHSRRSKNQSTKVGQLKRQGTVTRLGIGLPDEEIQMQSMKSDAEEEKDLVPPMDDNAMGAITISPESHDQGKARELLVRTTTGSEFSATFSPRVSPLDRTISQEGMNLFSPGRATTLSPTATPRPAWGREQSSPSTQQPSPARQGTSSPKVLKSAMAPKSFGRSNTGTTTTPTPSPGRGGSQFFQFSVQVPGSPEEKKDHNKEEDENLPGFIPPKK
jgi:hypothetical protein